MADKEIANNKFEEKPRESLHFEKVFESQLLKSVSKTHSLFAILQSFGLDILIYGSVFIAGQRHFGPIWMIPPIGALVLKDLWSAERERRQFNYVIRTLRDDRNHLILADPHRLPPWVHHPDIERCNWLNRIMSHFWPFICTNLMDLINHKVDPAVSKNIPGLKIKKVSLGIVPPKVSGIKVYDKKVSASHLIVDAYLCYSGDCEVKLSYRGIPAGVENVQLHGLARIDLLLIETLPFIGGVEFAFLGVPNIDFVLTGVGSVGFTEEALRKVLQTVISSNFVFPKKIGKVWNDTREDIKDPEGVIRVNVIEAKKLENKDYTILNKSNKSDPYAEVIYGGRTYWSRVIEDSLDPYWDLWCEFVMSKDKAVTVKVMDQDPGTDDHIGTYHLKISDVQSQGKIDSWFPLEGSKGSIHIKASFLKVSADVDHVAYPPQDLSFLSTYTLTIMVQSAHNLLLPRSLKKPNAVVQVSVGNDTQETKVVENSDNPVYGETFNFLVNNPYFNKLRAKVFSDEGKVEIGSFSYSLRKLLDRQHLEILDQHFPLLDSASDSTVIVSMRLRVIQNVF